MNEIKEELINMIDEFKSQLSLDFVNHKISEEESETKINELKNMKERLKDDKQNGV